MGRRGFSKAATGRLRVLPSVILATAGAAVLLASPIAQPVTRPLQQSGPLFHVDINLVTLSVTARDEAGAIVHDLRPDEFQLFEDGREQELAHFGHHESPISVVVLFDKSSSMADEKLMHAKDAVVNFVKALTPQDEVLIIAFSDWVDVLGEFGLDAKTIEREVKRIRFERSTRLYDAAVEASKAIAAPERKEKRALLILSDGQDTASTASLDDAVEAVKLAGVPVYAIGIELDDWLGPLPADPLWTRVGGPPAIETLKRLTDGTGGWTYAVAAAKRCKEICLLVADELRNQYLLGYYPANKALDGGWRTITVTTARPGVRLTTRSGYYAPAS